jgi:hypothetical protein
MKILSTTRSATTACAILLSIGAGLPAHAAGQASGAGTPPAPERLWAAQTAADAAVLSWHAVPGATEYRLECALGDAAARPIGRPAGNATQWHLRLPPAAIGAEHRCTLAVVTATGVSKPTPFNPFVPRGSGPPPTPPTGLTARQTAETEITVSWSAAAGATAYFLARAVEPEGFRVLCHVCPIATSYVDTDVVAGRKYSYSIAAIAPGGTSRRVNSNGLLADPAFGQSPEPTGETVGTAAGNTGSGTASTGGSGSANSGTGSTGTGAGTTGSGSTGGAGARTSGSGTAGSGSTGGAGSGAGSTGGSGGAGATTGSATPQACVLEYQRADNMWAALGRPDGQLGTERITLQPGQSRTFVTDWAYEKRRNDGTNYYGSHARIVKNAGDRPVSVRVRGEVKSPGGVTGGMMGAVIYNNQRLAVEPTRTVEMKADILEASCDVKH